MTAIDRPTGMPVPGKAVVRVLTWFQVAIWGGYLLLLAKLMIAGIAHGGFGFWPFGSDPMMRDPKEVLGGSIVEQILHLPLLLIVVFGAVPAALLLIASLPYGALLWAARDPRRWWLSVCALLTAVFLAVQLTPFHSLLVAWMLD